MTTLGAPIFPAVPLLRASACVWVVVFALVASCSSTPKGVVSLQARGALDSPAALQALYVVLLAAGSNEASDPSGGTGSGTKTGYDPEIDGDTVMRAWGFRAAINTPIVDVVGGIDEHMFGSQDVSETSIGLRKRFPETDAGSGCDSSTNYGYFQVLARRGYDIETDFGPQDYDAIAIGIGCIAPIGESWFFDISLEFESTLERLDVDGDHAYLSDVLFNVGLGFSL